MIFFAKILNVNYILCIIQRRKTDSFKQFVLKEAETGSRSGLFLGLCDLYFKVFSTDNEIIHFTNGDSLKKTQPL